MKNNKITINYFRFIAFFLMLFSAFLIMMAIDQIRYNNILINSVWLWVFTLPVSIFLYKLSFVMDKVNKTKKGTFTKLQQNAANNFSPANNFVKVNNNNTPSVKTNANLSDINIIKRKH